MCGVLGGVGGAVCVCMTFVCVCVCVRACVHVCKKYGQGTEHWHHTYPRVWDKLLCQFLHGWIIVKEHLS